MAATRQFTSLSITPQLAMKCATRNVVAEEGVEVKATGKIASFFTELFLIWIKKVFSFVIKLQQKIQFV
jgi:hypothetical protein